MSCEKSLICEDGRFVKSTPQFNTSVPNKYNTFSATKNPSVQHTPQFNAKNPLVQHQKALSSTPKFFDFRCWTEGFLMRNWGAFGVELRSVLNWGVFDVELRRVCGTEGDVWNWRILGLKKEWLFCVEQRGTRSLILFFCKKRLKEILTKFNFWLLNPELVSKFLYRYLEFSGEEKREESTIMGYFNEICKRDKERMAAIETNPECEGN